MQTKSAKAKGKALEKFIVAKVKEAYSLDEDDIRCTVGQEAGSDIKLTRRAKTAFPFSVEAKNREIFRSIYKFYTQASEHYPELVPLLVIKMNRQKPLVVLDFEHFLTVINHG